MKGVDINDVQMESACEFLTLIAKQPFPTHDDDFISIKFSTMVRLIAWYGAMRYQAAERGIGSLEKPNGYGEANLSSLDATKGDRG